MRNDVYLAPVPLVLNRVAVAQARQRLRNRATAEQHAQERELHGLGLNGFGPAGLGATGRGVSGLIGIA